MARRYLIFFFPLIMSYHTGPGTSSRVRGFRPGLSLSCICLSLFLLSDGGWVGLLTFPFPSLSSPLPPCPPSTSSSLVLFPRSVVAGSALSKYLGPRALAAEARCQLGQTRQSLATMHRREILGRFGRKKRSDAARSISSKVPHASSSDGRHQPHPGGEPEANLH